jgi:lactate permease
MLLAAAFIGYFVFKKQGKYQAGAARKILTQTSRSMGKSSISILAMVSMAVLMEHAGMTTALAAGLANGLQSVFPLVAPWIGALGAFITGSNTNSNVVFGALQLQTAQLLNLAAPVILAGQTAGAGLASILAPTKVIVGATTAGMSGREGEIMRKLIVYGLILVGSISLLTLAGVLLAN